ncbi:MAG: SEC-C domain-containing protein [Magnetococcales bacterium]|nr:SEC-C domain-containing protein [Magnetococcales bacterium]
MGSTKDLNQPEVFAEALVHATLMKDREKLAAWLAEDDKVTEHPFWNWYAYFADRLIDMAPSPEMGFQSHPKRSIPAPKIGRNDPCPCQSGKKFKQCHINQEESVGWKLGSPTPAIRAMAVSRIIQVSPVEVLDQVPQDKASDIALTEMATAYHAAERLQEALDIIKKVLDGDREDPHILWDYWIARYAEWLVEADKASEGEQFLMDEYDTPRQVQAWQVAQKLAAYYIDQGDTENAETWVDTALEGNSENPFNHYLKGLLLHSVENWEEAEQAYTRAQELSENFREEEKAYMTSLVGESLTLVKNRQPLNEEEAAQEEN